ncbi:MAG: trypsin-like peptidase domain-containing protein [Armatimonadia bacterium]
MTRPSMSPGLLLLLAAVLGIVGGLAGGYIMLQRQPPLPPTTQPQVVCPPSRLEVSNDSNAIVNAVKKAGDSVVKVIAAQAAPPNIMDYLFGGGGDQQPQVAIGSGFIFNYEGRQLVLTNAHVADGAQQLVVKLVDGREIQGRLAGGDPASDIAAIELVNPPANLKSATLGDSDALQVGEWVIAIGNPYDYEHTVTVGVVSAMGYRAVGRDRFQNVIQTDAAINSGNSGGPLVNVAGEVVGINYRIFSPTGSTVGIGFAIPINSAKRMLYFLSNGGPWIGEGDVVTNNVGLARYLGLSTQKGVLVVDPVRGGPAQKSGLRPRDVVLRVGNTDIGGSDQFRDELLKHKIGETVLLLVQRGDQQFQLQVVTGRHPDYRAR